MGTNNASIENGKNTRFTSQKQPRNRGRKRSIFGPLERENDLSLDDVRKVYKNILTAKSFEDLDKIKTKYPSIITEQTIEMLKQDKRGRLVGTKQIVVMNEDGEVVKVKGERERSYETIQYMLDRIFGTPTKVDLNVSGNIGMDINELSRDEQDNLIKDLLSELKDDVLKLTDE